MAQVAELLKTLNIERGRKKTAVTKFNTVLQDVSVMERPLSATAIVKLETQLEKVRPKCEEFTELHYKICDLQENEDEDTLQDFENAYYDAVAGAKVLIDEHYHRQQQNNIASPSNASESSVSTSDLTEAKIKLPTIALPTFDGKPELWLEFRDVFSALIHNDQSLNDIKRFYYLKSSLRGDAKQVIQGIETSADNYRVAWDNLCERYENKRILIQNHLSAVHNLEVINKESSVQLRELLDKLNQHLRALSSLGQPVDTWDTMIIYIVCTKLDQASVRDWELQQDSKNMPTLDQLRSFLRNKANMLESLQVKRDSKGANNSNKSVAKKTFVTTEYKCYHCKGKHPIYSCYRFKNLSVQDRIKEVGKLKLCANCLRTDHVPKDCTFNGCKLCNSKHNSLLHLKSEEKSIPSAGTMVNMYSNTSLSEDFVLLSTAIVNAISENGKHRECRVLLDNGSQSNLITERMVKRLGLRYQRFSTKIGGVYDCKTTVKGKCSIKFKSKDARFASEITCLVLPEISDVPLPQFDLSMSTMSIPLDMQLADPNFGTPGQVDMLIGASIFWQLLQGEMQQLGSKDTMLINTKLGWIVSGTVSYQRAFISPKCYLQTAAAICEDLTKFWEIEEFPTTLALSDEEMYCEEHFLKNTKRGSDGRFQVRLPFKHSLDNLGFSKAGAEKRFYSLERKLINNANFKEKYCSFMSEYERLGHMTHVPEANDDSNVKHYFLPHHGVLNENSTTTKLRVVFDGSFATSTGLSRNSLECVGPVVQSDLVSILLRFRSHKIAISADVEKMYRQVQVQPEDRGLQQILWRDNPTSSLKTYQLNTVTYGTASASFLATRCLLELANIYEQTDSALAKVIRQDFYVDDLLTGANTEEESRQLCEKLNCALNSACFPLRKWTSNVQSIFNQDLYPNQHENLVQLGAGERTKTLGLFWQPHEDQLSYTIGAAGVNPTITKRVILSSISQVFDPLGLVGACLITVKMHLQELWKCQLEWDSEVPENIARRWTVFRAGLQCLNELRIPRFIMQHDAINVQLHGFADASEKAYGACVYIRSVTAFGNVTTHLLCAKSKVAPLKALTIPRLELCAALVLAKLTRKVCDSLHVEFSQIYLWSDSTIVLNWLRKQPNLLKVFVSNRVAKITNITAGSIWNHVPTDQNPADLISRGLQPQEIVGSSLWWQGPMWLSQEMDKWPATMFSEMSNLPETRLKAFTCLSPSSANLLISFERFSNYQRLVRAVAYVFRFINRCRRNSAVAAALDAIELTQATAFLINTVQRESFACEINRLSSGKPLKTSSKLLSLAPYLDSKGFLRVGGRLENSELCPDAKHPVLLPASHALTKLLFRHEHTRLGHAGPQLLLCSIRDKFWPLRGKGLARDTVRNCVRCYRTQPCNKMPQMGSLPSPRVTPSPVFNTTGVDYAGPFTIKDRKGRGCKTSKCYIALFICFATKAIHLEVVSDLTTDAFIASFKRFIARRGRPSAIWSDNGTNFVGADAELRRIIQSLNQTAVVDAFSGDSITWHFIPANSPHFGGLWESGVRGSKFHLKRILANACLTFEEFSTVCCQVESFLNSRPLIPMSENPNDLEALTPSHFLIGRKLLGLPEENLESTPTNRLSRFQFIQQLSQHFWHRWTSEYLNTLQGRTKWKTATTFSAKIGDLVLIKDDNQPPLKWPLARVIETHAGKDGVIRVVTVRTNKGVLKRAVSKVFSLPSNGSNHDDLGSA